MDTKRKYLAILGLGEKKYHNSKEGVESNIVWETDFFLETKESRCHLWALNLLPSRQLHVQS